MIYKKEYLFNSEYCFSIVLEAGIYMIVNTLDDKKYIGSSKNIRKRFFEHQTALNGGRHHSILLQRAWNKYGDLNFKFVILELCEPIKDTLLAIEQKYLDLNPEYNILKTAGNTIGFKHSDETKRKIAESNRKRVWSSESRMKVSMFSKNCEHNRLIRKPVVMYGLENNYELEFDSISSASNYIGHVNARVSIKRCCQGKLKTAFCHKWKYKNDI